MSCYITGDPGSQYCETGTIFLNPIGIVLAAKGVYFSAADFLDKTKWEEKINARQIFPLLEGLGEISYEMVAVEYSESATTKKRKIKLQGKYRTTFKYDLNDERLKELQNFRGFTGGLFLLYSMDTVRGITLDAGDTVQAIRVDMLNVEPVDLETGLTPIVFDFKNEKDINKYSYGLRQDWDLENSLDSLTKVDIAVIGTPTATEIKFTVSSSAYGKTNPILGLALADINADVTGTATDLTINSSNEYTLVGTLFASGTIDLKIPTLMETTDLFVVSSGSAIVTIT